MTDHPQHKIEKALLEQFGISSTNRISFQIYNNLDELDYFEDKLKQTIDLLI